MTTIRIDASQHSAARIAGFMYLFLMATAVWAFYIRSGLIVAGDAAETARNFVASEQLFRASMACDVLTFAGVVVLVTALYVMLAPVQRNLVLLATFWRLVETAILAVGALVGLLVLLPLGDAAYLEAFDAAQLEALARMLVSAHARVFTVGFVFLGLGAMVFSYVLYKSDYVPRILAGWGVFAYMVMVAYTFSTLLFPELAKAIGLLGYAPAGVFEISVGLWLLFKGIREPRAAVQAQASTPAPA